MKPKKSIAELVLEEPKGSTVIKEVIKESPPPEDKVIAPASEVKNMFLEFKKKNKQKKRRKRIRKVLKKKAAKKQKK